MKKPPYVEIKGRRKPIYYWQPTQSLKSAGWKTIRLPDDQKTAFEEARKINRDVLAWREGRAAAPDGTMVDLNGQTTSVGAVINAYLKSPAYREMIKPITQKSYAHQLKLINQLIGQLRLEDVSPQIYQQMVHDHLVVHSGRGQAKHILTMARILWNWATANGHRNWREPSPLKFIQTKARGTMAKQQQQKSETGIWSPEQIALMARIAREKGRLSLACLYEVGGWIGQRPTDLRLMSRACFEEGSITIRQSKTNQLVSIPLRQDLAALLTAEMQRYDRCSITAVTLFVNDRTGLPWDIAPLQTAHQAVRAAAALIDPEIAKRTIQELRHTAVVQLAEADCTIPEIASWTGHSFQTASTIVERYARRRENLAKHAFNKRTAHQN